MNIIIFGANELTKYIAANLAKESHAVYLIDSDRHQLDKISSELDISVIPEEGNSWAVLEQFSDIKPDVMLAMTQSDEKNLALCKIAKNLNYPTTIAFVKDERYIGNPKLDFNEIFSVDYFICPNLLISQEIFKFLATSMSAGAENFAHGTIHMHTMKISDNWKHSGEKIMNLKFPEGVMLGLIKRLEEHTENGTQFAERKVIFPHGKDTLMSKDEVTFVGKPEAINRLPSFFNVPVRPVRSVAIVGGNHFGMNLAKILVRRNIRTIIIEADADRCKVLSSMFPEIQVYNQDGTNLQFLLTEQIGKVDAFVSCTSKDEINILAASLGKKIGCDRVIATIEDTNYSSIIEKVHIDHFVSPRETMANRILSIIEKQKVLAVSSLYENKAKILELKVSYSSPIAGIPISELGTYLPNDFLFAAIQNRGRTMIADGNKVLVPGDTVVVISNPQHYNALQKLF